MAAILIAEDDQPLRDFVRRALEMDGHDVSVAHDGGEAADMLRSPAYAFDLVIADIRMPVMDGIALALMCARDLPGLTLMLMTGYMEQRDRAHGLDEIVHEVLLKPFTLEEVRARVKAALATRG